MRINKVDEKIWYNEVEKYKFACKQLEKTITCTMLKYGFMGLKCWSWYPGNAPDDLNINTFSDFLKYLGEEVYYRERPTKEQVCEYAIKLAFSKCILPFSSNKFSLTLTFITSNKNIS